MRSVGTRTTQNAPRGPPPLSARRRTEDRSFSAERPHPATVAKGTGSSGDDRSYSTESSSYYSSDSHNGNRQQVANGNRQQVTNGNRQQVANGNRQQASSAVFLNGAGRREGPRGAVSLDVCGNSVTVNHNDNHNPPNMLPISGTLEQNNDGLVRPSAFKPVVPKNFHSMQNLVCPPQAGTGGSRGGAGGGPGTQGAPREQDSPSGRGGASTGGGRGGQGGLSDSGRNSLTSLPTYAGSSYGPPATLAPLSASTSHINRLGSLALDALDQPGYQNGRSASDSGRSSSGKSSSSYQRLCQLGDAPAPLRPSPSSDDLIQDLEDRLWEREQEVLNMRRNLDQSEAAIVQVFEEKQRVWEREMEDLRQNYAGRLQQVTRRAQRTQQALQAQISRLQQDKRRLQDEIAALLAARSELERKCVDYRKEQADILPRLEETKWEVCQKAGEISLLKQQLRDSQAEVTQRSSEMVALRNQLKDASGQLREREEAVLGLTEAYSSRSQELQRCEGELQRTLTEVSVLRDKLGAFEAEVLGLQQALGELSGGRGGGARSRGGGLLSPLGPPEAASLHPHGPTSLPEALLSLQSDEAKAQRQEAQRGEAGHPRGEAGHLRRQLERLQGELRLERQQRERQALTFAQERLTWQGEKERVLKYQAQLQLSYVEMLQKNQALERAHTGTLPPSPASPPALPAPPAPLSPPPAEDQKLPALQQLAPPWPAPTRLERIESTEI